MSDKTIIAIRNISDNVVSYIPKAQNFIVEIRPGVSHVFEISTSDVLYYLQQATDRLLVEQVSTFDKLSDSDVVIKLPATVTLSNNSDITKGFIPYRENFMVGIQSHSAVKLSAKTSEEALYYLQQAIPNILEVSYEKPEQPETRKLFNYRFVEGSTNKIAIIGWSDKPPVGYLDIDPLIIPSTYDGYQVESIENKSSYYTAFSSGNATKLVISNGVKYIRTGAFKYLKKLKTVELGEDIIDIESNCFKFGREQLIFIMHSKTPLLNTSSYWAGDSIPEAIYVPDDAVDA